MVEIRQTLTFTQWLMNLRDREAQWRINVRLRRMELGNPGDARTVGDRVSELRIDHGPGYRVYFTRRGLTVIILLCGGDKRTQDRDIKRAQEMVDRLE
jgi:putative addiction module killer protein